MTGYRTARRLLGADRNYSAGGFGFFVGGACGLAGTAGSAPGPAGAGGSAPGGDNGGGTVAQATRTSAMASATRARRAGICKVVIIGVCGGSE